MSGSYVPFDLRRITEQHAAVKVRDILKLIKAGGWFLDRTRGSHRQYKHRTKRGVVTVPSTQNSILKQAQLK